MASFVQSESLGSGAYHGVLHEQVGERPDKAGHQTSDRRRHDPEHPSRKPDLRPDHQSGCYRCKGQCHRSHRCSTSSPGPAPCRIRGDQLAKWHPPPLPEGGATLSSGGTAGNAESEPVTVPPPSPSVSRSNRPKRDDTPRPGFERLVIERTRARYRRLVLCGVPGTWAAPKREHSGVDWRGDRARQGLAGVPLDAAISGLGATCVRDSSRIRPSQSRK